MSSDELSASSTPIDLERACRRSVTVWPTGSPPPNSSVAVSGPSTTTAARVGLVLLGRGTGPRSTLAGRGRPATTGGAGQRRGPVGLAGGQRRRGGRGRGDRLRCRGRRRRRPSASASPMVSVDAEPKPPRTPALSVRAARRDDEQVGAELVDLVAAPRPGRPLPRPTVRTTAVMPIRMPSMSAPSAAGGCGRPRRRCGGCRARSSAPADPRSSASTRPSRICTMRSARAATSCSWVISTIVRPCACSSSNRPSTSAVDVESRLPVGSSARIRSGSVTSARATATRCCWPPDSSPGRWSARSASPTLVERGRAPARRRSARLDAGVDERQLDVAPRRQVRRAG